MIELLVVIAIIMLLISMGLPNYLDALTRSNVAATEADYHSLRTALQAYYNDYRQFPDGSTLPPPERLEGLIKPVRYLEEVPRDRFGPQELRFGYLYGAMDVDKPSRWILSSAGPDRAMQTDPIEFYPGYDPLLFIGEIPGFRYMVYSPTNGIRAEGDIYGVSDGQI